ncbi:MAG TPA: epoxide hydrolase [Acidimicrobiia bacterium]|nr:epoxide hydrolase [Acidimicrobiia bacterium]
MIERFDVDLPEADLDELRSRLRAVRWPRLVGDDDWRFGVPRAWMQDMVRYWAEEWDWGAAAAAMNRFEHVRIDVDGVPIHVMHVRGAGPDPTPLVLTHGWPWTFWDFRKVVGPLADPGAHGGDPADSFDVYVPSLPGFGFSTPLSVAGIDVPAVARLWVRVMADGFGIDRFAAHGGDWGSLVTSQLAHAHAEHLIGAHQTLPWIPGVDRRGLGPDAWADDEAWMRERMREADPLITSHRTVHTLDPQTLAYGLADSPVGTAAWLWERRRNWSDCDGDVESVFDREHLCTTAALYWCTGAITSSLRIYHEQFSKPWPLAHERTPRLEAPTGVTLFQRDLVFLPRRLYEEQSDLRRWSVHPRGGHFSPMEQPEILVDEIRGFFRALAAGG